MVVGEKSPRDRLFLLEGPMENIVEFLNCVKSGRPYTGDLETISPEEVQKYVDGLSRGGLDIGEYKEMFGYRMPLSEKKGCLVIARRK